MKAFPTKHPIAGMMDLKADGMDLRDYFAAKFYKTSFDYWEKFYFSNENDDEIIYELFPYNKYKSLIAERAYEMADAMMKARNNDC